MRHTVSFSRVFPKSMIFALLWWLVFQPDPGMARIYKYKDDQGKTHFTNDASQVPLKYRKQGILKKYKGVVEPKPKGDASADSDSSGKDKGKDKDKGDGGLTSKDAGLIRQAAQVLSAGIALGNRFGNAQPTFSNGQGAIGAIQSGLPLKENLAGNLEGTKVPELQAVLGFLKKSIAIDKETKSIGAGLKRRIANILSRLANEGKQQAELIKGLEKAMKNSEKKKAEARRKKAEEAKKEFEKKKAESEKRLEEETGYEKKK